MVERFLVVARVDFVGLVLVADRLGFFLLAVVDKYVFVRGERAPPVLLVVQAGDGALDLVHLVLVEVRVVPT